MKKAVKILSVITAVIMVISVFSSCGANTGVSDNSEKSGDVTLRVYNWGEYIDPDVLTAFEEETGIKIEYSTFNDNESMYAKVKNAGDDSYDVVFPSDYMVKQMIKEDMLAPLDFENIPNAAYTQEQFKNPIYDPENKYSVPYLWDLPGILYNTDYVDEEIDSLSALFDDKYAGKVCLLDSMRDTIGLTLKYLGYSMNDTDPAHINEAKELLISKKKNVLAYGTDELAGKVMSGSAYVSMVYSGEGLCAMDEAENVQFAIPKEGTNIAIDCMVILKSSSHKKEAEQFINYLSDPEVSLKNADYTMYHTVNAKSMELLDEETKNDKIRYPDVDMTLGTFEYYTSPNEPYVDAWTAIKASK